MWPTLFRIPLPGFLQDWLGAPDIPIRSFGLLVMLGFLLGLWYAIRLSRRFGADPKEDAGRIADLAFWLLLGIVAGGRLLYVFLHSEEFQENPFRILVFWEGGMVFYGGFLLAFLLAARKAPRLGLDFWKSADYLMVAGMLGYAVGRVGCLLLGDDYGKLIEDPASVPWALHIPNPLPEDSAFPAQSAGKYLHPAQVYMSLIGFALAALGRWLLPRKKFDGQVYWNLVLLYAIVRFVIEFYRGDDEARVMYASFSTSQWIATGMALISVVALSALAKREKRR